MVNPVIGTVKFLLTAIWGVNGFHLLDLMLSQWYLLHNTSWSMLWRPWFRWSSRKGGFGLLLDSLFILTTAVFTSQSDGIVFIENQLLRSPRLLDSPNLAPSNF
jgi:hypothetical protein